MPRRHRTISVFLIVSLSFIFPLASTYSNYNALIEADFLTLGVKFEAGDIDDLLVDRHINVDFLPSGAVAIDSLEIDRLGLFIISSFQISSIASPFYILRC